MAAEVERQRAAEDLNELLAELKTTAAKTGEQAKRLDSQSQRWEGSSERLIEDMAENLSTLREAVGLPRKDPAQFKETIERRQRDL